MIRWWRIIRRKIALNLFRFGLLFGKIRERRYWLSSTMARFWYFTKNYREFVHKYVFRILTSLMYKGWNLHWPWERLRSIYSEVWIIYCWKYFCHLKLFYQRPFWNFRYVKMWQQSIKWFPVYDPKRKEYVYRTRNIWHKSYWWTNLSDALWEGKFGYYFYLVIDSIDFVMEEMINKGIIPSLWKATKWTYRFSIDNFNLYIRGIGLAEERRKKIHHYWRPNHNSFVYFSQKHKPAWLNILKLWLDYDRDLVLYMQTLFKQYMLSTFSRDLSETYHPDEYRVPFVKIYRRRVFNHHHLGYKRHRRHLRIVFNNIYREQSFLEWAGMSWKWGDNFRSFWKTYWGRKFIFTETYPWRTYEKYKDPRYNTFFNFYIEDRGSTFLNLWFKGPYYFHKTYRWAASNMLGTPRKFHTFYFDQSSWWLLMHNSMLAMPWWIAGKIWWFVCKLFGIYLDWIFFKDEFFDVSIWPRYEYFIVKKTAGNMEKGRELLVTENDWIYREEVYDPSYYESADSFFHYVQMPYYVCFAITGYFLFIKFMHFLHSIDWWSDWWHTIWTAIHTYFFNFVFKFPQQGLRFMAFIKWLFYKFHLMTYTEWAFFPYTRKTMISIKRLKNDPKVWAYLKKDPLIDKYTITHRPGFYQNGISRLLYIMVNYGYINQFFLNWETKFRWFWNYPGVKELFWNTIKKNYRSRIIIVILFIMSMIAVHKILWAILLITRFPMYDWLFCWMVYAFVVSYWTILLNNTYMLYLDNGDELAYDAWDDWEDSFNLEEVLWDRMIYYHSDDGLLPYPFIEPKKHTWVINQAPTAISGPLFCIPIINWWNTWTDHWKPEFQILLNEVREANIRKHGIFRPETLEHGEHWTDWVGNLSAEGDEVFFVGYFFFT